MSLSPENLPSCRERKHMTLPVLSQQVEQNILLIRGHRVMLDTDMAKLYGVPTKRLTNKFSATRSDFLQILCSN